jgi:hypothetical protein
MIAPQLVQISKDTQSFDIFSSCSPNEPDALRATKGRGILAVHYRDAR